MTTKNRRTIKLQGAMALAAAGIMLLATTAAPAAKNAAAKNAAGVIHTVAGTGASSPGADAGPALKINIGNPFGVELGPDGGLYICEVSNHRIRRLDLATERLITVAGCGKQGDSGDGGPAAGAELNEPYEVRFDDAGNMFFVEMKGHRVRKVDARTGRLSTVAGTGEPGYSGDGGPATAAKLKNPHSIAVGKGTLYIADIGNHRIRRVDLASGRIDTLAGNGEKRLPVDKQKVTGRPMLGPRALFLEDDNTLWVALREGHSVWKIDLASRLAAHVAGTGKRGLADGPAKSATFNGPKGIAVGPAGHVYVVDTENQVIRKIDASNSQVTTVAGAGPRARGYGGDGGSATEAKLNRPHGICIGQDGTLYIGDSENHRVRRVRVEP